MKINAKEILERLGEESVKKAPASIYVSELTLEKFKQACDPVPFSRVLESLMEIFIQSKGEDSDTKA